MSVEEDEGGGKVSIVDGDCEGRLSQWVALFGADAGFEEEGGAGGVSEEGGADERAAGGFDTVEVEFFEGAFL
jgi:hypothetical protein